jgi:hypothetical protein
LSIGYRSSAQGARPSERKIDITRNLFNECC